MAMPLTVIDPLVPLLKLTVCVGRLLPSFPTRRSSDLVSQPETVPVVLPPLPVRATVRGLPASEVLIVTLPVRVPLAGGVKQTTTLQLQSELVGVGKGAMPQLFCWL